MLCQACGGSAERVSLEDPVDYEYRVVPARKFRYRRCDGCATEWLDPRPSADELVGFYPLDYHAYNDDHGAVAGALVWVRGQLRGRRYRALLAGDKGALFDVGAGDCRHFAELQRVADWSFAGVEIQPALAERGRAGGYDIETGTLELMDIARHRGKYDVVSMNHVLEHVLQPGEVVARAFALLRPGGHLIGQLPTNSAWEAGFGGTWAGYHYPRHLQVFSRRGLQALIEGAGFQGVKISSAPHCQTAISMQNDLLSRGVSLPLKHGRTPVYGALLLASLPFELAAWACNRSGTVDFLAQKPRAKD
jgi:SAM-dependent methyltransferase